MRSTLKTKGMFDDYSEGQGEEKEDIIFGVFFFISWSIRLHNIDLTSAVKFRDFVTIKSRTVGDTMACSTRTSLSSREQVQKFDRV